MTKDQAVQAIKDAKSVEELRVVLLEIVQKLPWPVRVEMR